MSNENIIRERIIARLNSLTLSELKIVENAINGIFFMMKRRFVCKPRVPLYPKIDPRKFVYTFGKNEIVCSNCFHFTVTEGLESVNGMATVCNDCVNGSAYFQAGY